jgi:phage tail-like protein
MNTDTDGFSGDTPVSSRFLFEIDGVEIGVFTEVSGLELKVDVHSFEEGGENSFVHKLPGRISWPHIVLRRGVTDSDALFSWVNKSAGDGFSANGNKVTRCTGAITVINSRGDRERAWEITEVFAVRWTGPNFDASANEPLHEELEIAHHGFRSKTFD